MAGHFIKINGGAAHLNCPNIYQFKGTIFEFHPYCGPMRCKKNGDPSNVPMGRKFWEAFEEWQKLTVTEQKETLIFS